jgi:hypothetical protein
MIDRVSGIRPLRRNHVRTQKLRIPNLKMARGFDTPVKNFALASVARSIPEFGLLR